MRTAPVVPIRREINGYPCDPQFREPQGVGIMFSWGSIDQVIVYVNQREAFEYELDKKQNIYTLTRPPEPWFNDLMVRGVSPFSCEVCHLPNVAKFQPCPRCEAARARGVKNPYQLTVGSPPNGHQMVSLGPSVGEILGAPPTPDFPMFGNIY